MRRLISLAAVVLVVVAGCGTSSPHPAATTSPNLSGSYPVTVAAANGSVTIPSRPARIMSLSATATSMLYAIGAGPQVVAVDKYSDDPASAPRTKLDGTEGAESYAPFHPDLVVVAFDTSGKLVAQLTTLHIPTLLMPPAKTIDDTYSQFEQLGQATGHLGTAGRENNTIRQALDRVTRSVGSRARGLSYYHELDNTLYTATSKTFIGSLYSRLGMINVADPADHSGSGYPQLSAEYLVRANPDFVFMADTQCCQQTAATFAARPGFSVLSAVRNAHVVLLADPIASEWGPRIVEFLQDVANAIEHARSPATTAG